MNENKNSDSKELVQKKTGADLVVDSLIEQGVDYIFGIPGAKIDSVFNVLQDRGPELIVARHEQNAAFMAQAIGRLTDKPGVVLVTSGPGASNLATGLVTANSEGDPVVAIAGAVTRADRLKRTHQSMDNQALFTPIRILVLKCKMPTTFQKYYRMLSEQLKRQLELLSSVSRKTSG